MPRKLKEENEKVKVLTISLTKEEEDNLNELSKIITGTKNKSGMVRYWINKYKHLNKQDE